MFGGARPPAAPGITFGLETRGTKLTICSPPSGPIWNKASKAGDRLPPAGVSPAHQRPAPANSIGPPGADLEPGARRNLDAALEAEAKLKDTLNQLHYNKTLALGRTNAPPDGSHEQQFAPAPGLIDTVSNLLPGPDDQHNNGAGGADANHRINQPDGRMSAPPAGPGPARVSPSPAAGHVPGAGDPLDTAADEHREDSLARRSHQPTSGWGLRRAPDEQRARAEPASAAYDDIVTWTPAAGPAAYRAGSGYQPAAGARPAGPAAPGHYSVKLSERAGPANVSTKRNEHFFAPALEYLRPAGPTERPPATLRPPPTTSGPVWGEAPDAARPAPAGSDAAYSTQSASYSLGPGAQVGRADEPDDEEQPDEGARATDERRRWRRRRRKQPRRHHSSEARAPDAEPEPTRQEPTDAPKAGQQRPIQWSLSDTVANQRAIISGIPAPVSYQLDTAVDGQSRPPVIKTFRVAPTDQRHHVYANLSASFGLEEPQAALAQPNRRPASLQPVAPLTGEQVASSYAELPSAAVGLPTSRPPSSAQVEPRRDQWARPATGASERAHQNWSIVLLPYPRPPSDSALNYFSSTDWPGALASATPAPAPPATTTRAPFGDEASASGTQMQRRPVAARADATRAPWPPSSAGGWTPPVARPTVEQWAGAQRLIQRGPRNAPNQQQQPDADGLLTIQLMTHHPVAVGPNQLFWEAAAREAGARQQAAAPKAPLSNGHHPPQHRQAPPQAPPMRRPLAALRLADNGADPLAAPNSHTNGHAYAGSTLKGPQFVAPPGPLGGDFGELAQLQPADFGSYAFDADSPALFPVALGPLSAIDESQAANPFGQLVAAAAVPASAFAAPPQQSAGEHQEPVGGPAPADTSRFLKKGADALPLATPAAVRDPYGWPLDFGSQAAKSLLRVNHVAPAPSYMIPADKLAAVVRHQEEAGGRPGGAQEPDLVAPLVEAHPMLGSAQTPAAAWAQQQAAGSAWPAPGPPVRPNVISLTLSTRPPTVAPTRRERFWQRLRLLRRNILAPNASHLEPPAGAHPDHLEPRRRHKRGVVDNIGQLFRNSSSLIGIAAPFRAARGRRPRPAGSLAASESKWSSQFVAPPAAANLSAGWPGPRTRLAIVKLGADEPGADESAPGARTAFIPLLDTASLADSLENDLLAQALLFSQHQIAERPAPMAAHESQLEPQYAAPGGPMQATSPASQPGANRAPVGHLFGAYEANVLAQFAELAEQHQDQPMGAGQLLEPPANEPGSTTLSKQAHHHGQAAGARERIRQISKDLVRSSRRPLTKLMKMGFGAGRQPAADHQHHNKSAGHIASAASSQRPVSMAQQFNNLVSPALMMAPPASSLDNFNRFAHPLHQWLHYQQQGAPAQAHHGQLLPLATHLSQLMSPYSFVTANRPVHGQLGPARAPTVLPAPSGLSVAAPSANQRRQLSRDQHEAAARWLRAFDLQRAAHKQAQLRVDASRQYWPRASADPPATQWASLRRASDLFDQARPAHTHGRQLQQRPNGVRLVRANTHQVRLATKPFQLTTKPSFRFVSSADLLQRPAARGQLEAPSSLATSATNHHHHQQSSSEHASNELSNLLMESNELGANNSAQTGYRNHNSDQIISYSDAEIYSSPSDQQPVELVQHHQQVDLVTASDELDETGAKLLDSDTSPAGADLSAATDNPNSHSNSDDPANNFGSFLVSGDNVELQSAPILAPQTGTDSGSQQQLAAGAQSSGSQFAMEHQSQFQQLSNGQRQYQQLPAHQTQQLFLQPSSGFVGAGPLSLPRPRLPKFSIPSSINTITNKFRQHLMQTFRLNALGSRWPNMLASPASFVSYHHQQGHQPLSSPVQQQYALPSQAQTVTPGAGTFRLVSNRLVNQVNSSPGGSGFYSFAPAPPPAGGGQVTHQFERHKTGVLVGHQQQQQSARDNFGESPGRLAQVSGQRQQAGALISIGERPPRLTVGYQPGQTKQSASFPRANHAIDGHSIAVVRNNSASQMEPEIRPAGTEQTIFDHEITFDGPPANLTNYAGNQYANSSVRQQQQQAANPLHNVMTDVSGSLVTSDGTYIQEDQAAENQARQHNKQQRQEAAPAELATIEQGDQQPAEPQAATGRNYSSSTTSESAAAAVRNESATSPFDQHQPEAPVSVEAENSANSLLGGGPEQEVDPMQSVVVDDALATGGHLDGDVGPGQHLFEQHFELERVAPVAGHKFDLFVTQNGSGRGAPEAARLAPFRIRLQRPAARQRQQELDYQVIKATSGAAQVVPLSNGTLGLDGDGPSSGPAGARQFRRLKSAPPNFGSHPAASSVVASDPADHNYQQPPASTLSPDVEEHQQQAAIGHQQAFEPPAVIAYDKLANQSQLPRLVHGNQIAAPSADRVVEFVHQEPGDDTYASAFAALNNATSPDLHQFVVSNELHAPATIGAPLQTDFRPIASGQELAAHLATGAMVAPAEPQRAQDNSTPSQPDQLVLVDQPLVLTGGQQPDEPKPASEQLSAPQTNEVTSWNSSLEQPAVFVSLRPEKVVHQPATMSLGQRKRPLKKPQRGQAQQGRGSAPPVAAGDQRANEASASQMQSVSRPRAGANETMATAASTSTSTTTRRPEWQPGGLTTRHKFSQFVDSNSLRNHNLKSSSTVAPTGQQQRNSITRDSFTRPPKAKIRWQGVSTTNNKTLDLGTNSTQTHRSELASSETSRNERAWIVGGMTHQGYASGKPAGALGAPPTSTGPSPAADPIINATAPTVYTNHRPDAPAPVPVAPANSSRPAPTNHRAESAERPVVQQQMRRDSRTGSTSFRLSAAQVLGSLNQSAPSGLAPGSSQVPAPGAPEADLSPTSGPPAGTQSTARPQEEAQAGQQQPQEEHAELVSSTSASRSDQPDTNSTRATQSPDATARPLGDRAEPDASAHSGQLADNIAAPLDLRREDYLPTSGDDTLFNSIAQARQLRRHAGPEPQHPAGSSLRIRLDPARDDESSSLSLASAKHNHD